MSVYLFDASSIVNLVKKGSARVFEYGVTIDLAFYEALNAVWKEFKLLGRIDEEAALEYVDVLVKVFEAVETIDIKGSGRDIFDIASREGLTIYDASYLYLAIKNRLVLVTDDQKLKNKASKHVEVVSSSQILTNMDRREV